MRTWLLLSKWCYLERTHKVLGTLSGFLTFRLNVDNRNSRHKHKRVTLDAYNMHHTTTSLKPHSFCKPFGKQWHSGFNLSMMCVWEDKGNKLTCCTGHTSRSADHWNWGTRHRYCTAHRPPQGPGPPETRRIAQRVKRWEATKVRNKSNSL